MKIREFKQGDLGGVKRVIKSLHPKWFDKKALRNIPIDVRLQKCFVAEDKDKIVGFISIYSEEGKAEVGWIGVGHDLRKRGIGGKLFKRAEKAGLAWMTGEMATLLTEIKEILRLCADRPDLLEASELRQFAYVFPDLAKAQEGGER